VRRHQAIVPYWPLATGLSISRPVRFVVQIQTRSIRCNYCMGHCEMLLEVGGLDKNAIAGRTRRLASSEMGLGDMSNAIATEKTDQFWTQTWPSTPDLAISQCQSFPASNLWYQGLSTDGVPWIEGSTSAMYNHVNVPNKRSCIFPPARIMNTANSYHPGGVNVTLCDGSVRFVKDSINLQIWRAVGSRNGGEVVSADSY